MGNGIQLLAVFFRFGTGPYVIQVAGKETSSAEDIERVPMSEASVGVGLPCKSLQVKGNGIVKTAHRVRIRR